MKDFIIKRLLPVTMCFAIMGGIYLPTTVNATNTVNQSVTKTINAVATSHLDTNWSWDLEQSIEEYLPETYEENVDLIKDYPDYKFNFEGAYRYQLLKEYYPEKFEELKGYINSGQWNVSGTALENGDVNVPSPEALFRNILYGNNYFLDNFGKTSKDIYLPDCFGFGYALPSIMAHSNLLGFSTQKLSWGNAFPNGQLPFDIGMWKGPDGKSAIADINLNGYWNAHTDGMRNNNDFLSRLSRSPIGIISALFGACGDRGGGASNAAVKKILEEQRQNPSQSIKVQMSTTDALMKSITQADKDKLSVYDGEMVMKQHGVGSYTSRVMSKRWNRQAEQMAYAAELTNVNSEYLGATAYPKKQLEEYWTRVIAHQFHDDITGTSNSTTYQRSYNDLMLSIKQFANEYQSGVSGVVRAMDTTAGAGEVAVVVNNPLGVQSTGTVTGTVTMPSVTANIKVTDDTGADVPCQIVSSNGNEYKIAFSATAKSLGYRKYLVKGVSNNSQTSTLSVSNNALSNEKYNVTIDQNGNISSVFDKDLNKELLSEPIRLGIFTNSSNYWAAWELNIDDYAFKKPQNYVGGTPTVQIVENGPARVALKITRTFNNSKFEQIVSLSAGGKMVQVDNVVDWQEKSSLLKAEFNLKPSNPNATYDLGLGTITRGNNTSDKSEVPLQKWADLTNSDNSYGVSIINDCKYGMDKYDDDTMRLTLIHTPKENYTHHSGFYPASGQDTQDIGENRFSFAIYGHAGNYASSNVQHLAESFNQPLYAYQAEQHTGTL
ncbi:MAG: alpha-mannosidase, partial [Oscillospiraceae bacterium]|nr:alpha-mannosidase [Oscillospiraceae bacterium]